MDRIAGGLAVAGGAMLVIGGFSGWRQLERVRELVETYMAESDMKETVVTVLNILIFFAMLGGVSVILGGVLVYKGFKIVGRALIVLGAGVGIMGLVINGVAAYVAGRWDAFVASNMTMTGAGLVLSAVARWLA